MPRRPLPREPGTERGYTQHASTRTVPCAGCLNAHARKEAERRDKGRCARGLGWPLVVSRG